MLWLLAIGGIIVWGMIAWGMWERGIWWFVGMMVFSLIVLTGRDFLSRWAIFFPVGVIVIAISAIGYCGGDNSQVKYSDANYSDDYLKEHYTNVQLGIQDAAAMSGIPIGGSASIKEFAAACDLLEAMNFKHSNTNNFITLYEQEPEWTLARLDRIDPPSALIRKEGRSVAAALRAGAIMGAIEGNPPNPKSEQRAFCEYIANR